MKHFLYFLIVFACCSYTAKAQGISCYHLHNGKFKIIDSVNKSFVIIERKDDVETEYLYRADTSQYDTKLTFTISWINDCTYTLHLTDHVVHTKKGDKHVSLDKHVLTNRIMNTNSTSCLVYTDIGDKKGTKFSNVMWLMN